MPQSCTWFQDGGKDSAKNILYADKVSVITGNGSGTVNRFAGVVEAQDTLKISLSEGQKVKEIFVEKGQEVEPGTKLFEYDTEELAMTLEQGNLELEKIGNSISNLNSQIAALTTEKRMHRQVSSFLIQRRSRSCRRM